MTNHFNQLTEAELERLSVLMEEMGEALHVIGKIQRHGFDNHDPTLPMQEQMTNRRALERELGHVKASIRMMVADGDIKAGNIELNADVKKATIKEWLHHQEVKKEDKDLVYVVHELVEQDSDTGHDIRRFSKVHMVTRDKEKAKEYIRTRRGYLWLTELSLED